MAEPAAVRNAATEIVFEEGIIGVPRARRFVLTESEDSPLCLLRCLDIEGFALPVIDPIFADEEYRPNLGSRVLEAIRLDRDCPVVLLAVATPDPAGSTANLRAPLVINLRDQLAAQVILEDRSYPLRAPLRDCLGMLESQD